MKIKQLLKNSVIQKICFVLISAAIFFILNAPLRWLQNFSNLSGLRISAIYPVSAGLLMGPYGALGCGIGNLLSDLLTGFDPLSILGFVGNFLFAYLPYKLWHTILPIKSKQFSATFVTKYVVITAFSVFASMAFISAGTTILGLHNFAYMLMNTTIFNFIFGVYGGMTLYIFASETLHLKPYIPKSRYTHEYISKRYIPDYIICGIILILILFNSIISYNNLWEELYTPISIAIMVSTLVLAFLPFSRSKNIVKSRPQIEPMQSTILTKIVLAFFIFITIHFIYEMLSFINSITETNGIDTDVYMWIVGMQHAVTTLIEAIVLLFVLIIILVNVDKKITSPILKLSTYTKELVDSDFKAVRPHIGRVSAEIVDLKNSIDKMTDDINNYIDEKEEQIKREESARQLMFAARNIQFGILPKAEISADNISSSSFIKPAQIVGGDFFDYIPIGNNQYLVCIADVSSKGLPAAMFMSQASMLTKCFKENSPEILLKKINDMLYETNSEKMFVTMFLCIINTKDKTLKFANAGHNYPIVNVDNSFSWLKTEPEPFLGMVPNLDYTLHEIKYKNDFMIYLYTDGVNEAENADGKFYGEERMEKILFDEALLKSEPSKIVDTIKADLKAFANGAQQSDDITMICIKAN